MGKCVASAAKKKKSVGIKVYISDKFKQSVSQILQWMKVFSHLKKKSWLKSAVKILVSEEGSLKITDTPFRQ